MVHPYLRRRDGLEPVSFPAPAPEHGPPDELVQVLGKTLGVPLFQEQAMKLAMEAARFTGEEANGLRRSMATFRHYGNVGDYGVKFVEGMVRRGYDPEFAQRCFKQIEGFGSYGFPESHAVSFAKLVYVSSWLKYHHPDVFCAALLNSQPMGFYQPAQLVRDAKEHGVTVLAPDILLSDWDTKLEPQEPPPPRGEEAGGGGASRDGGCFTPTPTPPRKGEGLFHPVRLGLRQIKGLNQEEAERLITARAGGARTLEDLARRARLSARTLELLAEADALRSLGMDRRAGLWAVKGLTPEVKVAEEAPLLALIGGVAEPAVDLPVMSLPAHVAEDYRTTSLSLKAHPCGFFRPLLTRLGCVTTETLKSMPDGSRVSVGGLVLIRQRPGTAKGVVFVTLEDETGSANAVVWRDVFAVNRRQVMTSAFLVVRGKVQRASNVIHVVAERFVDLTGRLADMKNADEEPPRRRFSDERLVKSRDFH
jgi:error-prone DNA polymerase